MIDLTGRFRGSLNGFLWKISLVIVVGLAIRYVLGLFFTYPTDVNYWVIVSENFFSNEGLYGLPGYYYTPVWGYMLAILTWIAGTMGIPLGEYVPDLVRDGILMDWNSAMPSLEYAMLIKTFLFIMDLLVAFVLYRIGCHVYDQRRAFMMFSVWFLCPFTIIISSIRMMFENVEILFLLLSILMMLQRRPGISGVMMGVSLLVKPYGLFLGLLMIGFAYAQSGSSRYTLRYLIMTLLTGVLIMLPVFISGNFEEAMIWLSSRSSGAGSGSGYNVTLYLMPALVLLSLLGAFIFARFRIDDFSSLVVVSIVITSIMLLVPGNIQYYLLLLPLILLIPSRFIILALVMFLVLSVFSFISYSTWSSYLYVHEGLWGADALRTFVSYLYPIDSKLAYNPLKTVTAVVVMVTSMIYIISRRASDAHI